MTGQQKSFAIGDFVFAAFMIALGLSFFIASFSLPPPALEPVGPAAFPRWVGVIQILLSIIVIIRAVNLGKRPIAQINYRKRYDLAIITILLITAYFAVLQLEWLSFQWATVTFAFFLTAFLFDWKVSKLPVAVAIALLLGIGLKFTFTEILYLDLP